MIITIQFKLHTQHLFYNINAFVFIRGVLIYIINFSIDFKI